MIIETEPIKYRLPEYSSLADALMGFSLKPKAVDILSRGGNSKDIKYLIHTEANTLFLRNYRRNGFLPRLNYEADLLAFLKAQAFPVPGMLTTRSGSYIYINAEGLWTASEYIEGYCYEYPNTIAEDQLSKAAALLGEYHRTVENYPGLQRRTIDWHVDPEETLMLLQQVVFVVGNKTHFDEIDTLVAPMLVRKLQGFNDLQPANSAIARLPCLQIHGDFHGANLIFGPNNTIRAVIDWEYTDYWMRAAEVQAAICMTCKKDTTEHFNVPVDLRRARIFLDAYEKIYPLSQTERKLMPAISRLDAYRLDFLLYNHYVLGIKDFDIFMPKDPSYWFWWEEHAREYANEVLGI